MNEAIERVKSQMRKGTLEYCILLILHNREAYSNDIIKILKENELLVVEGTLYPLLSRMKSSGLLAYTWVENTQGPPRKYYKITEKGESFLGELYEEWSAISRSVELLRTGANEPREPQQYYNPEDVITL